MDNIIGVLNREYPAIVVVIPVRDEADRIGSCLVALEQQELRPDVVVLFLNNCTDDTEIIARNLASSLHFDLQVISRQLPPAQANAGYARAIAMAFGAQRAGPDGILLTTDADTIVPVDWIRLNCARIRQGADLVCGRVLVDPVEAAMIPAHLHEDDRLECSLIRLLDDMAWIIDPDPYNPPRRHTEASGASLAVSVAAFTRVGGIPPLASGEDRAFVDALRRIDGRIRHDPAIAVVVSGRIVGRAEGGMADAIRRRMVQQDEFTDEQIEPAKDALQRLTLRHHVRSAWSRGLSDNALANGLDLDPIQLNNTLDSPFFGTAWAEIEHQSSVLRRNRVRFVDLPVEISAATRILARLEHSGPKNQRPALYFAGKPINPRSPLDPTRSDTALTPHTMAAG